MVQMVQLIHNEINLALECVSVLAIILSITFHCREKAADLVIMNL